jgi:hypothetical protein
MVVRGRHGDHGMEEIVQQYGTILLLLKNDAWTYSAVQRGGAKYMGQRWQSHEISASSVEHWF